MLALKMVLMFHDLSHPWDGIPIPFEMTARGFIFEDGSFWKYDVSDGIDEIGRI